MSAFQFEKGFLYLLAEGNPYFPFGAFEKERRAGGLKTRTVLEFPTGSQGLTQNESELDEEVPTEEGSQSMGHVPVESREDTDSTVKIWLVESSVARWIH